jgi:hypothetical protein
MNQEEQKKKVQKVIAKAWEDETFKERLLSNPAETLRSEGLEVPPEVEVRILEKTNNVYYFFLPPKPSDDSIMVESLEAVETPIMKGMGGF